MAAFDRTTTVLAQRRPPESPPEDLVEPVLVGSLDFQRERMDGQPDRVWRHLRLPR
jgi:hypothetical protein